jgi:hypothetical protein
VANTYSALVPKLLASALVSLRQNAVTPRLVLSYSDMIAGRQGSTVDVPVPTAIQAQPVTAAATPPTTADMPLTTTQVVLDQWYEAPFYLTDKELQEVWNGTVPMQAQEAIKTLVNQIDNYILGLYKKFYSAVGTAGTTPFGTPGVKDAANVRKLLNKTLAPLEPRHFLVNPDAEGAALVLPEFANGNFTGSFDVMNNGMLNRKLGFQWWMNQNMPRHVTAGATGGALTVNATNTYTLFTGSPGVYTPQLSIVLAKATANNMVFIEGDIITFTNTSTQQYVVTAAVTITAGSTGTVNVYPPLVGTFTATDPVVVVASHDVNLAFHRDAIAFATRPMMPAPEGMGNVSASAQDPISGLTLRLEITREFKRTRWSFDMLYGAAVIRRELGCRLLG